MSNPRGPYVTAQIHTPNPTLDLSGSPPFRLILTLTLHASRPILIYTHDTFLDPRTALHQGGISFSNLQSGTTVDMPTFHVNCGPGPYRPRDKRRFKRLEPGRERRVEIPFGSLQPALSEKGEKERRFDVCFWLQTGNFKTGETYSAVLPSDQTVTWWRWAGEGDGEGTETSSWTAWVALLWRRLCGWRAENRNCHDNGGVPVLPDEEQMPILVLEGKRQVGFVCVGEYMGPVVGREGDSRQIDESVIN